jgi:DNA-directed RNA polymerase beta' subunit
MLVRDPKDFKSIKLGIASPEQIRFWSHGEVKKPETINYRTFKPERHGLFCERIFGPVKDWECTCGKYRRVRYRGITCERCGVEITNSKVRRERMGHIELAAPVAHIWFLKGVPSHIGLMLDMPYKNLERVVYYESYMVTKVHESIKDLKVTQLLQEAEYNYYKQKYGQKFQADMGAKAVKDVLDDMDLDKLLGSLRRELAASKGQTYLKLTKRIRVVEAFLSSGNKPSWMVMDCVPVMPPDLRPMVQLEGGRFAASDLNDLYRRVLNRNNRLKRLLDIGAPNMIVRNEKRMLQEAVDVLFDNGKHGREATGTNGRPLRSISNIIEGKQGRFRQNLLGKRVDYSGRSVIVVGPSLKLHQCGLPKEMAIELFKPFIIHELVDSGEAHNIKDAKRKIENKDVVVYNALEKVIKGHPVMLNRAPTLHRLGIQAFEPVLVEGKAIQIHPLVCTAFNADFDGDQMAVHVPLSTEAQAECRILLRADNNILSASNGSPIITPTQDMVIGLYWMTMERAADKEVKTFDEKAGQFLYLAKSRLEEKARPFANINEAMKAYNLHMIRIQQPIRISRNNLLLNFEDVISLKKNEAEDKEQLVKDEDKWIRTTIGRLVFNDAISKVLEHFNKPKASYLNYRMDKGKIRSLISEYYDISGAQVTAELCDQLKNIGFHYATKSGVSASPPEFVALGLNKARDIGNSRKQVAAFNINAGKEEERIEAEAGLARKKLNDFNVPLAKLEEPLNALDAHFAVKTILRELRSRRELLISVLGGAQERSVKDRVERYVSRISLDFLRKKKDDYYYFKDHKEYLDNMLLKPLGGYKTVLESIFREALKTKEAADFAESDLLNIPEAEKGKAKPKDSTYVKALKGLLENLSRNLESVKKCVKNDKGQNKIEELAEIKADNSKQDNFNAKSVKEAVSELKISELKSLLEELQKHYAKNVELSKNDQPKKSLTQNAIREIKAALKKITGVYDPVSEKIIKIVTPKINSLSGALDKLEDFTAVENLDLREFQEVYRLDARDVSDLLQKTLNDTKKYLRQFIDSTPEANVVNKKSAEKLLDRLLARLERDVQKESGSAGEKNRKALKILNGLNELVKGLAELKSVEPNHERKSDTRHRERLQIPLIVLRGQQRYFNVLVSLHVLENLLQSPLALLAGMENTDEAENIKTNLYELRNCLEFLKTDKEARTVVTAFGALQWLNNLDNYIEHMVISNDALSVLNKPKTAVDSLRKPMEDLNGPLAALEGKNEAEAKLDIPRGLLSDLLAENPDGKLQLDKILDELGQAEDEEEIGKCLGQMRGAWLTVLERLEAWKSRNELLADRAKLKIGGTETLRGKVALPLALIEAVDIVDVLLGKEQKGDKYFLDSYLKGVVKEEGLEDTTKKAKNVLESLKEILVKFKIMPELWGYVEHGESGEQFEFSQQVDRLLKPKELQTAQTELSEALENLQKIIDSEIWTRIYNYIADQKPQKYQELRKAVDALKLLPGLLNALQFEEFSETLKALGKTLESDAGAVKSLAEQKDNGSKIAKVVERSLKNLKRIRDWKKAEDDEIAGAMIRELGRVKKETEEKVNNIWRNTTGVVTEKMQKNLGEYNSVFMMANSGARGNIDQVRQLSAMRGLMADAKGRPVKVPITSNLYDGMSLTEFFISSYGARKGLVDTAMHTAESGYLTRRLVDVAQDVIITEEDCGTTDSITLEPLYDEDGQELISLRKRLFGRVAAETLHNPDNEKEILIKKGEVVDDQAAKKIEAARFLSVKVRSPLTCTTRGGICRKCYGYDLSTRKLINVGEAVGVIAAQSIGEPGTQLTMRTFHTGGAVLGGGDMEEIVAPLDGTIYFHDPDSPQKAKDQVRQTSILRDGKDVDILVHPLLVHIKPPKGNKSVLRLLTGSELSVKDGQKVKKGELLAKRDKSVKYIFAINEGKISYHGFVEKPVKKEYASGGSEMISVANRNGSLFIHNSDQSLRKLYIVDADKELLVKKLDLVDNDEELAPGVRAESSGFVTGITENENGTLTILLEPGGVYPIKSGAQLCVPEDQAVQYDQVIAIENVEVQDAGDITAGLPRVEEVFEARHPQKAAALSEIDGQIDAISEENGRHKILVRNKSQKKIYEIPLGSKLNDLYTGKQVKMGEQLTKGPIDPHNVITILGKKAAQLFLVNEELGIYLQQGVSTNDKHIEVIVRQMTKKVRIREIGDSPYLVDDFVDVFDYEDTIKRLKEDGKAPPVGDHVLLGLTKASLNTDSYISAASFQETTSVLTKAAVYGKQDGMAGLKENVIIGKLIPAGTGLRRYEHLKLLSSDPEISLEPPPEILEEEVFKQP